MKSTHEEEIRLLFDLPIAIRLHTVVVVVLFIVVVIVVYSRVGEGVGGLLSALKV